MNRYVRMFGIAMGLCTGYVGCSDDTTKSATDALDTAHRDSSVFADTLSHNTDPEDEHENENATDSMRDSETGDTDTADTDSDVDTQTDTSLDTGAPVPDPVRFEAECAFGAMVGDCNGRVDGNNSQLPGTGDADTLPWLENDDTTVGYIDSGVWLAYPAIDLTGFNALIAMVASDGGSGSFDIRLDDVNGTLIGVMNIPDTGGWTTWQTVSTNIEATDGIHDIYIVGGGDGDTGIGNVDWFELSTLLYRDPLRPASVRAADLLQYMTLDEKIGQMTQANTGSATHGDVRALGLGSVLSGGSDGPFPYNWDDWADFTDGYIQASMDTRLGIPLLFGIDAVHGHAKMRGATIVPHNIGLGATRNPSLVQQLGALTATEMAATGTLWTFAPAVSVARDERWGRTYESFGEHPSVSTMMTTLIDGLQGTHLDADTSVLACAKHYAGDGGAAWGSGNTHSIDQGNAVMSEAAFDAIHVAPFYQAVARNVGTVMPSYSSFNGTKMHEYEYWLTDVLKEQMGFQGFVISDWEAVSQVSGNTDGERFRNAVNAGVDMFMEPRYFNQFIATMRTEVNEGRVSMARIDDAVLRILTVKFSMGLFESPLSRRHLSSRIRSDAHRQVARQAVRESLVLLKHQNNLLPLDGSDTICLSGSGANSVTAQSGGWTLGWTEPEIAPVGVTIQQALDAHLAQHSGSITGSGCDVGIRVVSENPATYAEYFGDMANPHHDDSGICNGSRGCVTIILGGRPLDIETLVNDDDVKALIMAWYPGSEGGDGIVDVLYRRNNANFTGKLPMTWKVDATNSPVNYCDAATPQCDDIGDHYSTIATPPSSVLFPYGFGLTY